MVGVGGIYLNTVECTTCHRELTAGENGLAQSRGAGTLSLAEALKSTPLPSVEDIAGLVLEELLKLGRDENVGNFVATFTGNPPLAVRTPAMSAVYEAFSWLQSRDMIAQGNQAGWYFVTTKGREIGTAANLKASLANSKGTETRQHTQLVDGRKTLADQENTLNARERIAFAQVTKYTKQTNGAVEGTPLNEATLDDAPPDLPPLYLTSVPVGASTAAAILQHKQAGRTMVFSGTAYVSGADQTVLGFRRTSAEPSVAGKRQSSSAPVPSGQRDEDRGAAQERDEALFNSLSPSSREALGRAAGLSNSLSQGGVIHMEHLIQGLYDKNPGPTRDLFQQVGLGSEKLRSLIYKVVETRIPETYPGALLTELPNLSAHVRQALDNAAQVALQRHTSTIHSRYLLYGALSIEACGIIKALHEFSSELRKEQIDLDGPRARDATPVPQESGDSVLEAEDSIEISSIGDTPASRDSLGFEPYVQAIARFLLSPDTKPPLTFSIEGEWGSGKSSFMLQLSQALDAGALRRRLTLAWNMANPERSRLRRLWDALYERRQIRVQFNPWRHDKEESLWAAFALEFLRQVSSQRSFVRRWWGRAQLFLRHYSWKARTEALRAVATWLLLLVLLVGVPFEVFVKKPQWTKTLFIALTDRASRSEEPKKGGSSTLGGAQKEQGEKPADLDPIMKVLLAIGGNGAYFIVVLSIWLKARQFIGDPLEIDLKKYLRSPNYEERVAFVERFHEDFKHIVDAYAGKHKVFVFVDDLDRCDVPKAADLMKAVNLLIADDPRLIFILGMDREKVAAGLAVKYEDLLPYVARDLPEEAERMAWKRRAGLEFGQAFLQKFIQLPFRVPSPNLDHYMEFLRTISTPLSRGAGTRAQVGPAPPDPGLADGPAPGHGTASGPGQPPSRDQTQSRRQRELQFGGDSDRVRDIAMMVAKALGANPRRLKQFINLFRLQSYIANELGFFDERRPAAERITFEQLGKFVAVSLWWPALLADFAERPDLLREIQQLSITDNPSASATARRWVREKGLKNFFLYGIDQPDSYSLANEVLYQLLSISPQRVKVRTASEP
jgi:hypothetical protein